MIRRYETGICADFDEESKNIMTQKTNQTKKNAATETKEFGTEVGRLLDLVVHSLYSDREIFLRELVANAADAMDKRRFEALTDGAKALPKEAKIHINPQKDKNILTISDDGAGMSREELINNLGTIARSGTKAFGEKLAKAKPEERPSLIGQFGVGFYAVFMVADSVDVISRAAGAQEAWKWHSDGKGKYTISEAKRDTAGTDIIMHMKKDANEFLEFPRLQTIIRKWSDHIAWPVTITHEGKEEAANEGTAIWRKSNSDISDEEMEKFYQHITHNFDKPWDVLHWHAEGMMEFSALLFIPSTRPFQFSEPVRESRVRLHVKRMFITDDAQMLPPWLRFVQGVVDTEDLPLNVSREMLQATPVMARIRKAVTKKVISELKKRAKDPKAYKTFWDNFGAVLKEGMWDDPTYKTDVAELSRFYSTHDKELTSLQDYVQRMKKGQENIYYIAGDNLDVLRTSPQIEGFQSRGLEVLLLTDPVDSFWPDRLGTFEGKKLCNVAQGQNDLEKFSPKTESKGEKADIKILVPAMKKALGEAVDDVKPTDRLTSSAMVLSAPQGGPDIQMRKIMERSGQALPPVKPILEINPTHPMMHALAGRVKAKEDIARSSRILLDMARIQSGEMPQDVNIFCRDIMDSLTQQMTGSSKKETDGSHKKPHK